MLYGAGRGYSLALVGPMWCNVSLRGLEIPLHYVKDAVWSVHCAVIPYGMYTAPK